MGSVGWLFYFIFFFRLTFIYLFIYLFIFAYVIYLFKFYFIFKLYIIVLVLPNIKMNPPQVYILKDQSRKVTEEDRHVTGNIINQVVQLCPGVSGSSSE